MMKIYLVGGAVRDRLLGLPVHEHDWVVVGATAEQMLAAGYRALDGDFPVFLHPDTGEEYALARSETKTGRGYKGFSFDCSPQVTLEQDLARRDFTINAIAEDEQGRLIDPYGGQTDLRDGLLRHITPAFAEDPLRVLRAARFCATLGEHGFHLAHGTFALLRQMSVADELTTLGPDRLWRELRKSLLGGQPWRFVQTLARCGALEHLLPELAVRLVDSGTHRSDEPGGPLAALQRASQRSDELALRFAALFLDCDPLVLQRLRPDKACRELLMLAQREWDAARQAESADRLTALFDRVDLWRRRDRWQLLLQVWRAVQPERENHWQRLADCAQAAAAVNARQLAQEGLRGPELGMRLAEQRHAAIVAVLGR